MTTLHDASKSLNVLLLQDTSAHTSTIELAAIATRATPGLLILYHQLFWGADPKDLLKEIREGYRGRVASGRDLDVYE